MFDERIADHPLVDRRGEVTGIVGDGFFDTLMRRAPEVGEAVGVAISRAPPSLQRTVGRVSLARIVRHARRVARG